MLKFKSLGVALLAGVAALAVSGAAHAQGKLVISNWDGYMPADMLERFTA
jgi:spermidine/putrescine-binding protein